MFQDCCERVHVVLASPPPPPPPFRVPPLSPRPAHPRARSTLCRSTPRVDWRFWRLYVEIGAPGGGGRVAADTQPPPPARLVAREPHVSPLKLSELDLKTALLHQLVDGPVWIAAIVVLARGRAGSMPCTHTSFATCTSASASLGPTCWPICLSSRSLTPVPHRRVVRSRCRCARADRCTISLL